MFILIPDAVERRRALEDIRSAASNFRLWWLLGQTDMRQRYSRSRLGPFWITISMAVFIASIGVINAGLFRTDVRSYLPFLAASYLTWTLISGVLTESTQAFVQSSAFLRQMALPKTLFVLRLLVRHAIAFGHNLVILPVVLALFGPLPGWNLLVLPAGLVLVFLALFGQALALSVLATRFRDLAQIVQNLLQLAFFATPVMWRPEQIPDTLAVLITLNPFAVLLSLAREPMLGVVPPLSAWLSGLVIAAGSLAAGLGLFARYRTRIVYWL